MEAVLYKAPHKAERTLNMLSTYCSCVGLCPNSCSGDGYGSSANTSARYSAAEKAAW